MNHGLFHGLAANEVVFGLFLKLYASVEFFLMLECIISIILLKKKKRMCLIISVFSFHFGFSRAMAIMVTALYLSLFYGLYVPDWEYQMPMDVSSLEAKIFKVSCSLHLAVYFSFPSTNENDGIL